ncbi:MAG TPA: D-2-hydroxyacid dehydrogenase family protein [Usitatibacter sp.]|nr:D-2-hydroxyacid dehydrogenase family protein [Usitatibacter sp.]
MSARPKVVVLDDYERSLRRTADWSAVDARADVQVHHERLRGAALLEAIRDADAVVVVRDRTPFKAELIAQLPKLRLFQFTGARNTQYDAAALKARGIPVGSTEMGDSKASTTEITWALILAAAKRLEAYLALVRHGGWRDEGALPSTLAGERLGVIGLGSIGSRVAQVGRAFGMEVVAWSPHMTAERAEKGGAKPVPLEELLSTSRVVTLHLVPSPETRKLLDASRLATMRKDAILVNTARSALIDMGALAQALEEGRPGMAALDVYDDEPLAADFPLARRANVVLTPHLGFVNDPVFARFGPGVVANLLAWLDGKPLPREVKD